MLKRIFKTILILNLAVALVIPSNAAISVSDGSAFVSKAELTADLNNISNRLAQLENSLDSKIDSLVSMYLSKNGIWSASNQELTAAVKNKKEYVFLPAFTTGNRGAKTEEKIRFSDAIVNRTNKSGMAFGNFSYGNKHIGLANAWYYGIYNLNGDQTGWIWDNNMCLTLSFYETNSSVTSLSFNTDGNITNGELKSVVEIGKAVGTMNWNNTAKILLAIPLPNWNTVPFVFFVEKDKKIWWRWKDEMSTHVLTAVYNSGNGSVDSGGAMRVALNEFSIY